MNDDVNPRGLVDFALAMRDVQRPPHAHQAIAGEDIFDVRRLGLKIALDAAETAEASGVASKWLLGEAVTAALVEKLGKRGLLLENAPHLFARHAGRVFVTEIYPIVPVMRTLPYGRNAALAAYAFTFAHGEPGERKP